MFCDITNVTYTTTMHGNKNIKYKTTLKKVDSFEIQDNIEKSR